MDFFALVFLLSVGRRSYCLSCNCCFSNSAFLLAALLLFLLTTRDHSLICRRLQPSRLPPEGKYELSFS